MYRVIICGSRTFSDYVTLTGICNKIVGKFQWDNLATRDEIEIIHGGADGADVRGERWAKSQNLKFEEFKADWGNLEVQSCLPRQNSHGAYNALAGHNRNQAMLDYALEAEKAIVISFYKGVSKGSKSMVRIAKKAGLEHFIWDDDKKKLRK